jgi:hypothetical protein
VETRTLNQAVRRDVDRFPKDFMFQLSAEEAGSLRSQIVISNAGRDGRRYPPYAFTEHDVEDIDRLAGDLKQMKALPLRSRRRIGFRTGNADT